MRFLIFLFCLSVSSVSFAESISTSSSDATLQFSGEHAGRAFTGKFNDWKATLVLPPADSPNIEASFALSSAETGNAMYDETLVEEDWFNVEETPTGLFKASNIVTTSEGYRVTGELELRGIRQPVSFELMQGNGDLTASFAINRLDFGIGVESDPDAEWVSREIKLELVIPR